MQDKKPKLNNFNIMGFSGRVGRAGALLMLDGLAEPAWFPAVSCIGLKLR